MITVKFYPKSKGKDTSSMQCSVACDGSRKVFAVGLTIKVEHWNTEKQRLKAGAALTENSDFNRILDRMRSDLVKSYSDLKVGRAKVNASDVIDHALGHRKRPATFFEYLEQFIQSLGSRKSQATGRELNFNTKRKFFQLYDRLREYERISRKRIDWSSFTPDWLHGFVEHLQSEGMMQNTIHKYVKALKQVLRKSDHEGVNQSSEWKMREFTVPQERVQNFYLTEDEVKAVQEVELSSERLKTVRDYFIIECWTGLRYSDVKSLMNIDPGDEVFKVTTKKTGSEVFIPLLPPVRSILEQYQATGLPEPISNQKFNAYMKEVGKAAGLSRKFTRTMTRGGKRYDVTREIWELLTSHVGRRSFASNMFLRGVPAINIMMITGHRTESEFMKYLCIDAEENAKMIRHRWQ